MVQTRAAKRAIAPVKAPPTKESRTTIKRDRPCVRNLLQDFNQAGDAGPITPPPSPDSKSHCIRQTHCEPFEISPVKKCNPIAEAKKLLSIGAVDGIVGREKELRELSSFMEKCLDTKTSSIIFVSGPPGTGKTLSVSTIVDNLSNNYPITSLFYNSMDFRRQATFYSKVAEDLGIKSRDRAKYRDKLIESIEKLISSSEKTVILTIDEIDKLDKDLVDAILDWPRAKQSKLILIGIANIITSNSLTKMTSFRLNCVKKVSFRPYDKDQLVAIIESRLQHLSKSCNLISRAALNLCAKKVFVYSGDARKALDIVRQAIEMAEREKCHPSVLGLTPTSDDGENQGSPRKLARISLEFSPRKSPVRSSCLSPRVSPRKTPCKSSPRRGAIWTSDNPLVEPFHIERILGCVFGNKLFREDRVADLTIQQQIILCCIICHGRKKRSKEITIQQLYKSFTKSCNLTRVTSDIPSNSDFRSICERLESEGLIVIKQAREKHLYKIVLAVNEDEVVQRLKDTFMVRNLMNQLDSIL